MRSCVLVAVLMALVPAAQPASARPARTVRPAVRSQPTATYAGRDPDGPWRDAARRRIRQHRMADLVVTVTDAAGKPVPGARVDVRMQRHAFGFGSAVGADRSSLKAATACSTARSYEPASRRSSSKTT